MIVSDYWKDTRLNYDDTLIRNLLMQSYYMEDVAGRNTSIIKGQDAAYEENTLWQYWGAFGYILEVFNEQIDTCYRSDKTHARARMKGMLDAMNTIIEMTKDGSFSE